MAKKHHVGGKKGHLKKAKGRKGHRKGHSKKTMVKA
jgi:hypothetical protein